MGNTPNYNLSKPESGKEKWDIDLNKNFDIIDESLFKKVQSSVFIAKVNNTSVIPYIFTDYDVAHDELELIYQDYNLVLTKDINYIEDLSSFSIKLTDWGLKIGESIKIKINRNSK